MEHSDDATPRGSKEELAATLREACDRAEPRLERTLEAQAARPGGGGGAGRRRRRA